MYTDTSLPLDRPLVLMVMNDLTSYHYCSLQNVTMYDNSVTLTIDVSNTNYDT